MVLSPHEHTAGFSLPAQKVSVPEDSISPCAVLMLRDWESFSKCVEGSITDILVGDVCEVKSGTASPPAQQRRSVSQTSTCWWSLCFPFLTDMGRGMPQTTPREAISFLKLLRICQRPFPPSFVSFRDILKCCQVLTVVVQMINASWDQVG
jgi:hypothetical protein